MNTLNSNETDDVEPTLGANSPGPNDLAVSFGELARTLQESTDASSSLTAIVQAAVRLIPGVDEASISFVRGRRHVTSEVPSGELPRLVDAVQNEVGQGPCLDAVYQQKTVLVPDMRHEQRWPEFSRRAADLGAAAMLAFQLYVQDDNLGALNLFSLAPNGFSEESEHIGLIFATHAALAMADARHQDQLRQAIDSRDLIGQAKGILMEKYDIDAQQAFAVLTRYSQDANHKLRDVCYRLVTTRKSTPDQPPSVA